MERTQFKIGDLVISRTSIITLLIRVNGKGRAKEYVSFSGIILYSTVPDSWMIGDRSTTWAEAAFEKIDERY